MSSLLTLSLISKLKKVPSFILHMSLLPQFAKGLQSYIYPVPPRALIQQSPKEASFILGCHSAAVGKEPEKETVDQWPLIIQLKMALENQVPPQVIHSSLRL